VFKGFSESLDLSAHRPLAVFKLQLLPFQAINEQARPKDQLKKNGVTP
jgi:hypothetical protein